jgi:hypothetical protein
MITGFSLVVLSWLVMLSAVSLLGYPLAYVLNSKQRGSVTLRSSLWLGTLVGTIAILTIGVFFPLRSGTAFAIFAVVLAIAGIGSFLILHNQQKIQRTTRGIGKSHWILVAALTLAIAYLALAALGPVTNYDSGLYHLGAIKYAGDYSTIPGLTNLYFPFGYNTSLYPIGAFLGNGPWSGNGFRLANGFLILLLVVDLTLRLGKNRKANRKLSTGTFFLLVATPLTLIPLVSLSDYWVTSPSSDAAVLVITLISVVYLLDALTGNRSILANSSVSFVAAVIAFSLRPTMVVFLIVLSLVLLYRLGRSGNLHWAKAAIPSGLGILLLGVQSTRDYFLSGWLQYPLSLFSFNVPWLAEDPASNRAATMGNARNPLDIWGSVDGFEWVGPYLTRLPSQWETYFVAGLALIAIVLIMTNHVLGLRLRWRTILVAEIPVFAALSTWFFFSPPTFRFGWGTVFSFFLILAAFSLKSLYGNLETKTNFGKIVSLNKSLLLPGLGLILIAVVGFNAAFRLQTSAITQVSTWTLGSIHIKYNLARIVEAPLTNIPLDSGIIVTSPTLSDQCWESYPLCTPSPIYSLSLRGESLQEGFLP